jgi:hypothetical protein
LLPSVSGDARCPHRDGPTASGVDGFRRSHFDAITTQQLMARLRSQQQIALFTDVQLVALITADTDRAAEFVNTRSATSSPPAGYRNRKDIR